YMNSYPVSIWKVIVHYNNGIAQRTEHFTKDGQACSSKGFALIDAKVDDLFDGDTNRFLFDRYESYLSRMLAGQYKPSNLESKNKRATLFRTYWGIDLPEDLAYCYDLWERGNLPTLFGGQETALPKFDLLE